MAAGFKKFRDKPVELDSKSTRKQPRQEPKRFGWRHDSEQVQVLIILQPSISLILSFIPYLQTLTILLAHTPGLFQNNKFLPTTFRKIFQHIPRSLNFTSKLDPQNTILLRIIVLHQIFRPAFNLIDLWESKLKFMRGKWGG